MMEEEIIEKFVRTKLRKDFVELHVLLVVEEAKWLLQFYPEADEEVVIVGAWLHDIGKSNKHWGNHHISGLKIAEEFLRSVGFKKIDEVLHCIESHCTQKPPEPETIEAKIIGSADNISHFTGFDFVFRKLGVVKAFAKLDRNLKVEFMLPEALQKCQSLLEGLEKEYKRPGSND